MHNKKKHRYYKGLTRVTEVIGIYWGQNLQMIRTFLINWLVTFDKTGYQLRLLYLWQTTVVKEMGLSEYSMPYFNLKQKLKSYGGRILFNKFPVKTCKKNSCGWLLNARTVAKGQEQLVQLRMLAMSTVLFSVRKDLPVHFRQRDHSIWSAYGSMYSRSQWTMWINWSRTWLSPGLQQIVCRWGSW